MAPVLKVLLEFLRIVRVLVRIARDYIKCFPRRGASLLALLGRKLNMWSVWPGKSGSFGCLRPTEPPFPGTKASSYSVSGGLGAVREYVVAASSVPASASHPSLHEHTERQPAAITQTVGVHPPVPNRADSPHPLGGRSLDNRSFGNLSAVSIQSRASDRLSIMINLRESTRAPLGQPSRRLRAPTHPYIHGSMTIHSSLESLEPRPSSPASSNPTMDRFLPEGRFVQLIHSNQVSRYIKEITIPRVETVFDVKPLTIEFPYFAVSEPDLLEPECSPWIPATHPGGALYFYDKERRLFTNNDMHDQTLKEEIEEFYNYLQGTIRFDQLSIPSNNYDLMLDITVTADLQIAWSYYYVCHDARCLFWLETYDASYMISERLGVKSPAHVKHRLEALYWNHWSLFPAVFNDRRVPLDAYDELMGILLYGCVDVTTTESSTLPYDDDTMRRMIQLVQGAKEGKCGLEYYTAGITRLLSVFAHWRFLYSHGQKHARLVKDQTVNDKPRHERSLPITILSPLLFLAPEVYLREMEELWTDEVNIETAWKTFMTKLLTEWEGVILWSTVMLTANVGFLAIPGVVLSNLGGTGLTSASQAVIFTSPSQIASSLSIEASIGSIVIGMLLVRHNRTTQNGTNSEKAIGLELMAINFSLPWALLMWSMVIFSIALLLLCFNISNVSTRTFVTIMSVLVATLIGWYIRTAWRSAEDSHVWRESLVVLRRTRGVLFERLKELNPFRRRRVPLHRRRVPQDGGLWNPQLGWPME